MGLFRTLPKLETWLDDHATSWFPLNDREYKALVRRWSSCFGPLIAAGSPDRKGDNAIAAVDSRLPGDVILFSGFQIYRLSNYGGLGASAYRAEGLLALDRKMLNDLELIAVSVDFSWSCLFSHEGGAFVWEEFYDRSFRESSLWELDSHTPPP